MNYYEKRLRWRQVQCKSWSDPDYSFLITELEKAWAALEFYADKRNWEATFLHTYDVIGEPGFVHRDQGMKAKEALGMVAEVMGIKIVEDQTLKKGEFYLKR